MYSLADIYNGLRDPKKVARELNRKKYNIQNGRSFNKKGIDIFEEDWDNLIILDACRYDIFEKIADLPGSLDYRISRGSATYEFIPANFNGRELNDTVYVTTNSWYTTTRDGLNSNVFKLIDLQYGLNDASALDPYFETVKPEFVTEKAQEANEKYPNKRLIVHYLQPHHPFIGSFGREKFRHKSSSLGEVLKQTEDWTREDVLRAYKENMDIVLEEVKELLSDLQGKTVITADHGEMIGERHMILPLRDYGHPSGIYYPSLVKVPWNVYQNNKRKEIQADPSERDEYVDQEKIEKQLAKLGYR
ncbi:hypothetical protein C487_06013 [Natrinema pallidum DSM 3751]|uniref:Sulfatase N-terminal domain-containing protein n=1 Tax=Natrinema pallidum DSM 3751 TaxID=1227495 RepID=L9Z196_9EURY|nr:hypothetical protein [Natrinema pallidum]ELY79681.1 hypothetical protein C487_06013 [Natrinema pallidum DSM 3751]